MSEQSTNEDYVVIVRHVVTGERSYVGPCTEVEAVAYVDDLREADTRLRWHYDVAVLNPLPVRRSVRSTG